MKSSTGIEFLTHTLLPTRSEKIFLTQPVPGFVSDPFSITAAKNNFTDYISIKIPGRGRDASGAFSPTIPATYRFLINPADVDVSAQAMDSQSFTRGGWQFGVAGSAPVNVHMSGKTPGRYFAGGLTDENAPFTLSYLSLQGLEAFFETNGYWWEGEGSIPTVGAFANNGHKLIHTHTDVELMAGEFIWQGMFDDMSIRESADNPHFAEFNISFIAWKEGYRNNTPYRNPIVNNVYRGHTKQLAAKATPQVAATVTGAPAPSNPLPYYISNPDSSEGVFTK
jgi:hypothetical protein